MKLRSLQLPGMEPQALRSCDIRRIVQERMAGFYARQLERRERRRIDNKRRKGEPANSTQESFTGSEGFPGSTKVQSRTREVYRNEVTRCFPRHVPPAEMDHISVVGRDIEVELYHSRIGPPAEWRARGSVAHLDFPQITPQSTAAVLREQLPGVFFEEQLTQWKAFDKQGELQADEWGADNQGKVFVTELRKERLKEAEKQKATERIHQRTERAKVQEIRPK